MTAPWSPFTQILRRLQQNERLPERNRQRLRLHDCGLQGLVASLPEGIASPQLCQGLYKLFVGTGMTWLGLRGRSDRGEDASHWLSACLAQGLGFNPQHRKKKNHKGHT